MRRDGVKEGCTWPKQGWMTVITKVGALYWTRESRITIYNLYMNNDYVYYLYNEN